VFVVLLLWASLGYSASTEERVRPEFVGKTLESEALGVGLPGVGLTAVSLMLPQSQAAGFNTPHSFDRAAARRSDFTGAFVGVGLSLTVGTLLEAKYLGDLEYEWLYTPLVAGESALYAFAVSSMLKRLVGRCRPAVYDQQRGCITNEAPPGSNFRGDEARRAWPSAHVMPVAGTAGAFVGTFVKGLFFAQPVRERLLASLVALSLSAATMVYRVRAGAHSEDDVWSAFGMGNGIGIILAWLHPMVRAGALETSAATEVSLLPATDGFRLVGTF
jgi:hypothetical protein